MLISRRGLIGLLASAPVFARASPCCGPITSQGAQLTGFLDGTGVDMFLSNGTSFVHDGIWTPAGIGSDGTLHVGDFNGDGKADLFRDLAGQSDVFLSNGSSFVRDAVWTGAGIGTDNQWYVGDFNGGGSDDIFRQLSGVDMFLNHIG